MTKKKSETLEELIDGSKKEIDRLMAELESRVPTVPKQEVKVKEPQVIDGLDSETIKHLLEPADFDDDSYDDSYDKYQYRDYDHKYN